MFGHLRQYFSSSLSAKTLLQFSIRITLVVVAVSALSYQHIFSNLEESTYDGLKNYITERGQKEGAIFRLAEDNHRVAKQAFLEYWQRSKSNPDVGFSRLFQAWPDGTYRIPQSGFDGIERGDGSLSHDVSGFIGQNAPMNDPAFRTRTAMAYWVISRFAEGWGNRFPNFYVTMPENAVIGYWPGLPWGLQAAADFDITKEEWYTVANPENLKGRESVWTGSYFDETVREWMVSCITPVDIDGKRMLNLGHDILLNSLFERALNDKLAGTYNFIVRADGRLIAHPDQTEALKQSKGLLYVKDIPDPALNTMVNEVLANAQAHPGTVRLINQENIDAILAMTPIANLDWYFVTVYPKSLLSSAALQTVKTILLLGLLSVALEMLMLYLVFRSNVLRPFGVFVRASEEVAKGNYQLANIDGMSNMLGYQNEVGRLAYTLRNMAEEIQAYSSEMEHKVAERTRELVDTQKELVLKQKMAALGVLTAGIAHEINNPNNAISGSMQGIAQWRKQFDEFLQQLMADDVDPEIQAAFNQRFAKLDGLLELIDGGSRRISSIVEGLRTLTRVDESARLEVDVVSGLDQYVQVLRPNVEGRINIVTEFQARPRLLCWAAELNQVFMNIISNACYAIEQKQEQSGDATPGDIRIRSAVVGDELLIEIADSGIGMSAEALERAMDPFFTTKTVGTGAGLGLSISRDVVEKHGGSIQLASVPGQGTTVQLLIPLVAPEL